MAQRKHLGTKKVVGPNGEDVRVMFYDDGALRFRVVKGTPMQIIEAFLGGKKGQDVIVTLTRIPN